MKPDGGPAFPGFGQIFTTDSQGRTGPQATWGMEGASGMSLRDYFAAHAPLEPARWFKYTPLPKDGIPPMPNVNDLVERHRQVAADWRRDGCFDLPEEIAWWGEKVEAHRKAVSEWNVANDAAMFIQWRWAYADAMLAERDKP
jgi:hypothetical protein